MTRRVTIKAIINADTRIPVAVIMQQINMLLDKGAVVSLEVTEDAAEQSTVPKS